MTVEKRNQLLTVVLAIIIVVLGWYLYRSITEPYEVVEKRQRITQQVRHNMEHIRDGLVRFNRREGHYPPTEGGLDTLVQFIKTDSLMVAERDSIFKDFPESGYTFNLDSLIYSPRSPHKRFEYTLNDTINPALYLLEDPDSDDKIGSLEKATMLNAPNWK